MKKIGLFVCCFALLLSAKPIVVSSQGIKKGSLDSQNNFLGVIKFKENSNIASQSSGVVEKVLFSVGKRVKKGDELVVLSSDLLQKDIQSKEARLQQAKISKEYQKNELTRYKNLLDSDSVSLQQYEKINYEYQLQELNILSLQAEVEQAKVELSKKVIKAPFDGVIVKQNINIGEWIKIGDSVCELLNNSQPEAIIDVPSSILSYISVGENVNLIINRKNYTGQISAIIPRADYRSRTFPVVIALPSNEKLLDGMAVNAMLKSGGKSEGYLIPRDSIIEYRNRPSIFVVRNGKAAAINVEVLAIQGNVAVVRGNLNSKDRVIYQGQYRLQDGAEIKESVSSASMSKKRYESA